MIKRINSPASSSRTIIQDLNRFMNLLVNNVDLLLSFYGILCFSIKRNLIGLKMIIFLCSILSSVLIKVVWRLYHYRCYLECDD